MTQARIEPGLLDQLGAKGTANFLVVLRSQANLNGLPAARAGRAGTVVDRLEAAAAASQAGIKAMLTARKAPFQSFWIADTIRVEGDSNLARTLAARPEVEQVVADHVDPLPRLTPAPARVQAVNGVDWNIDRIRAPEVWSTFADRGQGIVVASIDTGVQFTHPALASAYRGNKGNGTFDHNYNWFDPGHSCPSAAPCPIEGHGTLITGVMIGDGGPGNLVGVAPGARWIAASRCQADGCPWSAALAAGQWILAPTDLNGAHPRPDLAPHVVNSSWGSTPGVTIYADVVRAWVAAGIFPVFSAGNSGPNCGSSDSPGDQVEAYSTGAFGPNNAIAGFSGRGPAVATGEHKPNIAAPGVDIRSSWPTNGYSNWNGTSMAAPHVAATVALIWSAAPSLARDVAATRRLLDETAIDTHASECGGTDDDNNVFGEGRLDAFAAVDAAPRPDGRIVGIVTDPRGRAVAGATVRASGPAARLTATTPSGTWQLNLLPPGDYTIGVSAPRWRTVRYSATVTAGRTTDVEVTLRRPVLKGPEPPPCLWALCPQ